MSKIYEQFDAATKDINAYAITKDGAYVGRVVFKYPKDGMGRQWAYVQAWGLPMVRGYASGCGYDKHSAAVESAVAALEPNQDYPNITAIVNAWKAAMSKDDGVRWDDRLKRAGFEVNCIV